MRRQCARRTALLLTPLFCVAPGAEAAPPGQSHPSLYVLELAEHDQHAAALALTEALKQRVRDASDYALGNTELPFEVLAAPCFTGPMVTPQSTLRDPPPRCLDHVGASLTGRALLPAPFLWGAVFRPSATGALQVRVHLWREGKPDAVVQTTLEADVTSERDARVDDAAERLLTTLLYGEAVPVVRVVPVGVREEGEVVIDGRVRGRVQGQPRLFAVAPGEHVFALRVGSTLVAHATERVSNVSHQQVRLVASAPLEASVAPPVASAEVSAGPRVETSKWHRARPWIAAGIGLAGIAVSTGFLVDWKNANDDLSARCRGIDNKCPTTSQSAVDRSKRDVPLAAAALALGLGGGVAFYFLSNRSHTAASGGTSTARITLQPAVGGAAANLSGEFQ